MSEYHEKELSGLAVRYDVYHWAQSGRNHIARSI